MVFFRRISLFFIPLVFLAATMNAQQERATRDTIVEIDGILFMPMAEGITETAFSVAPETARKLPSQLSFFKKRVEECLDLFRNDSLLNQPQGLKVIFRSSVYPQPDQTAGNRRVSARFETAIFTTLARDSAPAWEPTPDAWITIHFNDPSKLAGTPVINDIIVEPYTTGDFYGYPEMDRISAPYRVVAVRKNNLPLFTPVVREDFILTLISFFHNSIEKAEKNSRQLSSEHIHSEAVQAGHTEKEKFYNDLEKIRRMDPELAEKLMQAYLDAGLPEAAHKDEEHNGSQVDRNIVLNSWREAVRKLKAEMNAMSPPERKSQAWWSNTQESNVSGLTPPGAPGARPLVRINKNLINNTPTTSSIQLLVVEWSMIPGTVFTETDGYNLAFSRLSQLGENKTLWKKVFEMAEH